MNFSITIPAYKSRFLKGAIESVLNQTYRDFELIVVDDCSPENLRFIVDAFHDSRISYFRNERNCGAVDVVDNWNICLSHCSGDYVICMGDDDRLLPGCLEEYAKLITKYPGLAVYHAWTEIIDENGKFIALTQPRPEFESALSLMINRWNGREQFVGDFCYNTKKLKDCGGYFKMPLAWASDDISAVRAALDNGIANMQVPGFQYRESSSSITGGGRQELKLKAAFLEREWYTKLVSNINEEQFSDVDKKYFSTMPAQIQRHFHLQRKICLMADINGSLIRMIALMKRCRELEISGKLLLYYWFESIVHGK